ncbi:imidazolonepropionase-like amidohydrolase [Amycolatopsis bartoniae]|uniref:Hydrolase n=1 Tax=Amycolatopsis bartoniae TaxID=941986 RepID=A0A8H9IS74_9PSEU|nr:amidohydrolase family protein [Amycolatopsis bartoniae]MBB2940253.1 imidazolonepropionase-like amidohydrolase [Amycolatopsis bartoniae]TVT10167.1 amidohydrolase family protein [Amycolatopsis bartoniae]GHF35193.1 hydrolase [Amycolatopsis bartoniae]
MAALIVNARVFDGTGTPPEPADVLVEGHRITGVGHVSEERRAGAEVIDGAGAVLMPGLIDGHTHLGFGSTVEHLGTRLEPDEEKAMLVAHAGRVMLDHGFTSCYSGGNRLPRAEVAARKAFAEGWQPGPRLRAASWEGSAGMVSPGKYDFAGTENRESDPKSVAAFVNSMADLGVDIVKLTLTGESALVEGSSRIMQFTEEEVAAAAQAAHERGVWLTAHAHSAEAVKLAVKYGVRAIYHATFSDEEAIDALAEARDRVFVAPTAGIIWAHLHDEEHPPTEGMETQASFESISRVAPELHKRGVRLVVGGDYGFAFNPIGLNARDLRLFVEWFGLSPAETLSCATRNGGHLMDMADELGLVRENYLADLLLVDGDPTVDIGLLADPVNLSLIMKDGRVHKLDPARRRIPAGARR